VDLVSRALPNSPKGYTPSEVNCPAARPSVRSASTLSPNETAWLEKRRPNTITPMKTLLGRLNITNFDAQSYIENHSKNVSNLPNIGIAISGGGWRALLNGAGAIEAFDSRTPKSTTAGHLGGLLQSSTYLAGLSGGSWLVGSIYMNNFSTVTALRDDKSGSVWEFGNSVLEGPDQGGIQILDTTQYYITLIQEVEGKSNAGFKTTLTDIWGRALSFQLINATDGGPAYTWSSIALSQGFQNGDTPFPVIIADERAPNQILIPQNTTIYEFNSFEMGSWDSSTFGFIPTKYLGSNFTAGSVPTNEKCTIGYDNGGFIMGTSSTLFNELLLQANVTSLPSFLDNELNSLVGDLGLNNEDIADYNPNPFYHYNSHTNPSADNPTLNLVDGGEDNQNIPFHPLIQPVRGVDVIFAVDSSADTNYNWPNGSSLVQTYERSTSKMANGTAFPSIPDTNTFINLGLNKRPTFFGCNASNITSTHPVPLIVYIPNAPYVTYSNVSTFDLSYNDTQRDAIILNGYDVATMANGTADESWPMCVGCAILSRSFHRTKTPVPTACTKCFDTFCWDGTRKSTKPAPYEPSLFLEGNTPN
jgi:lysophospholipase